MLVLELTLIGMATILVVCMVGMYWIDAQHREQMANITSAIIDNIPTLTDQVEYTAGSLKPFSIHTNV